MINRILRSFGLPADVKGWLMLVIGIILFLILSKLFGWLIAVIIVAVAVGLINGFYTQRKPRP